MPCLLSVAVFLIVLGIGARTGQAHDTLAHWPGTDTIGRTTIYLTDDTGAETTGRLIGLDEDSIALLVDGATERFPRERVSRLEKRGDSLLNGAIMGALIGGAFTALAAAFADCPDARSRCPGTRIAYGIGGAAVYGAIGAGIDALIPGRTTLYKAAADTSYGIETGAPGTQLSFRFRW